MSPSPETVCAALEAAASRAVAARQKAPLVKQDGPIEVELTLVDRLAVEVLDFLPMFRRLGANTIGFRADDMAALSRAFAFLLFFKLS